MSQSFEDKIKQKLAEHSPSPSTGAKEALFSKLATSPAPAKKPAYLWYIAGIAIGLISILSLFLLTRISEPSSSIHHKSNDASMEATPSVTHQLGDPINLPTDCEEDQYLTDLTCSIVDVNDRDHLGAQNRNFGSITRVRKAIDFQPSGLSTVSPLTYTQSYTLPQAFDLPLLSLVPKEKNTKRKQRKAIKPYLDMGVSFLYQDIRPNTKDDLVISNFQGQSRLSKDRLGYFAEVGVYNVISDRVSLSLGGTFSLYRRKYTFDIRESKASDAILGEANNQLTVTPIFNKTQVKVDDYMLVTGIKFSGSFYLFPSRTNSLFLGLEFGKVLHNDISFSLADRSYNIHYRDQLLINAGLRKTILVLPKGNLSIIPNIRYSVLTNLIPKAEREGQPLSIQPFSIGLTLSYTPGNML